MSVRIVAIGTFLAFFAGNVLAAERIGSTIEAQSTVSGEGAAGWIVAVTAAAIGLWLLSLAVRALRPH